MKVRICSFIRVSGAGQLLPWLTPRSEPRNPHLQGLKGLLIPFPPAVSHTAPAFLPLLPRSLFLFFLPQFFFLSLLSAYSSGVKGQASTSRRIKVLQHCRKEQRRPAALSVHECVCVFVCVYLTLLIRTKGKTFNAVPTKSPHAQHF